MKNFLDSEFWMWAKATLIVIFLLLLVLGILSVLREVGLAEGESGNVWVLCDPESYVCLRDAPRKTAYAFGGSTCGTRLKTDGKTKNKYIHVVDVPAESSAGWISSQYIVYSEPRRIDRSATVVSNGRLAARNGIGGKIRKWLKPMDTLTIYYWTSEWCFTNYGYVQSMYLELDGEA